jgi:uncharacterized membrane protein
LPTSLIARARRPAIALAAAAVLLVGLVPAVTAADSLAVTTPYPSIAVAPGSNASFDLSVTAPTSGTVDLSVSGAPTGWKATLHGGGFVVSGVTVTSGKAATARLDVDVPADTTATKATLTVEARFGSQHASLVITVGVDAAVAGDITLTTASKTLTGSSDSPFTFDLTLQNGSAEDQNVSATATGPAGWTVSTKLSQANAASILVKAGSSTTITVTATPPTGAPAGHTDIAVSVTAGTKTIPGTLGIDITGSYTMTMSTPGDLLSAHGSAGSASTVTLEITNTGTAALDGVKLNATPPTGWTVTYDPKDPISVPPGQTPGTITATITPSAEAVAGDYVVSFNATSAAGDNTAAATAHSDIRFTVETSPIWALVGIGVIAVIVIALFYVFRTYGRR